MVTDHSSLVWVFKTQKPSTHLIQWALHLQEFTFSEEQRKGTYNPVPDALSRAPINLKSVTFAPVQPVKWEMSQDLPISDENIWKAQQEDGDIQQIFNTIMKSGEIMVNKSTKFTILEDTEYFNYHTKICSRSSCQPHFDNSLWDTSTRTP